MRAMLLVGCLFFVFDLIADDNIRVYPVGQRPGDQRLGELRNLNSYFPYTAVEDRDGWEQRQAEIRRRILVSQGLWPLPTKTPLNAVVHGRVERDDYTVDRVFFESIPGHYVTGSLYRPKGVAGPHPAILSPHGHWSNGRFYDAGEAHVRDDIKIGAEQFEVAGRYPIQARAVQLARMGCVVFIYDMTGNADSIQIGHRPAKWSHLDREKNWGFMSAQAELRLQNMMGLQTWNSIRVIDFLSGLDDVDASRIGVTGASGGGTQSMIIGAIDDRIAAAMPCVMVSTGMQGGCTCENAPLLRIGQGNIDIAAAIAPRPLGLTAADDWTVELETKGYPDLIRLYEMLGHGDRLTAVFHTQFKHNYNQVNRAAMYRFFNRHFDIGRTEPITERDFVPLSKQEATVWNDDHPAPSGDQVGDAHEVRILRLAAMNSEQTIGQVIPETSAEIADFLTTVAGGWETILDRRIGQVGEVTFEETGRSRQGDFERVLGRLVHASAGEQIPAIRIRMAGKKPLGRVVWIADHGKQSVVRDSPQRASIEALVRSGYEVLSADLFGQGEFLAADSSDATQPMWIQRGGDSGWHRFSGYTYGYNHPLFVKRVHDVLSLIKLAGRESVPVRVVGLGKVAGALAAAAVGQAGESVEEAFIDADGFRFETLRKQDDPMFVPGAVKFLDVDGLLAIALPTKVTVVGAKSELVAKVYRAGGAADSLSFVPTAEDLLRRLTAN